MCSYQFDCSLRPADSRCLELVELCVESPNLVVLCFQAEDHCLEVRPQQSLSLLVLVYPAASSKLGDQSLARVFRQGLAIERLVAESLSPASFPSTLRLIRSDHRELVAG